MVDGLSFIMTDIDACLKVTKPQGKEWWRFLFCVIIILMM
jgi:hypothetical protein